MRSPTDARCSECWRKNRTAMCFPVRGSKLEQRLSFERFKCERCGREWKVSSAADDVTKEREE